jgi:hypothetical protein
MDDLLTTLAGDRPTTATRRVHVHVPRPGRPRQRSSSLRSSPSHLTSPGRRQRPHAHRFPRAPASCKQVAPRLRRLQFLRAPCRRRKGRACTRGRPRPPRSLSLATLLVSRSRGGGRRGAPSISLYSLSSTRSSSDSDRSGPQLLAFSLPAGRYALMMSGHDLCGKCGIISSSSLTKLSLLAKKKIDELSERINKYSTIY